MAPAKFERILSVSSEDPAFPAENLLKNTYSDKKWKCNKTGEKQISVVIQLEKAELITAVDVGNYGSAFIEILVGKTSTPDDYKVLVVTSSLMSLQDSKLGSNLNSVRFFKEDSLVPAVLSEKWDRIKVVCSQPYNKIIQYGLSFLVIHTANTFIEKGVPALQNFQLKKKENSDSLSIGSLFAKRKESSSSEVSGAAAIRVASTTGVIGKKSPLGGPSTNNVDFADHVKKKDEGSHTALRKNTSELKRIQRPSSPKPQKKNPPNPGSRDSSSLLPNGNSRSRDESKAKVRDSSKKKSPPARRLEKPFNKLFEGVVFAISGFQNPYRSELRSKALQMGAKYRPDWDNTCTHLFCAFPNTPKFDQVLGHGKIVTKFWVENCYDRRMRLPWRRFALHPPDKNLPESEEEVFEFVERPPSPVDNRRRVSPGSSSGPDTDEEIQRVLERQNRVVNGNKQDNTKDNQKILKDGNGGSDTDVNEDSFNQAPGSTKEEIKPSPPSTHMKDESPIKKKTKKASKRSAPDVKDKKSPILKKKPKASGGENIQLDDVYILDTEEEDESWDSKMFDLPHLPEFFEGRNFHISGDLPEEEFSEIRRYILAHKGSLIEEDDLSSKDVHYVIAKTMDEVEKVKAVLPEVVPVRPEWIWKAHDEGRIPPISLFQITE